MELGRMLTADIFKDWVSDVKALKDALDVAGYDVPDDVSDILDFWLSVSWDDFLISQQSEDGTMTVGGGFIGVFNVVEYLIESINRICDWVNPNAQQPYSFERKNGMLYPYVKRWFDWAEYNGKILAGAERKRQYLYTTESTGLEQLFDVNGEPVITREGYFEGGNV